MVVFTGVKKEDLQKLKNYHSLAPKTIYEDLRLEKDNVKLILYSSGKLLLQGKQAHQKKIVQELKKCGVENKVKPERFRRETGMVIGSDETLKGDTFGGLVVAGVKADQKTRQQLLALGVADSKTLTDKEITTLAEKIKHLVACEIKTVFPEEYNQYDGVTPLLNKLHKEIGDYLKPGQHVVDKYPGCNVGDILEEKAESKYVEVAAASILARDAALKQLASLSRMAGFTLPRGSTHVKLALHELKDRELDFNKFVKLHFNNVKEFL